LKQPTSPSSFLTRARAGALAPALPACHMLGPMAGSLMKHMRKAGITDPVTGELVPFPYSSSRLPHAEQARAAPPLGGR
jgi:hypothetical protein